MIVIRGTVYFAVVFGIGFMLGVIRVLWVEPRVGERTAELLEAPLMLVAIYCSARFVTRRFPASRAVSHLCSGVVALLLLLAVEFSVVLGLEQTTIREHFAARDPVAGGVYAAMLIIFAVMPSLVGDRRGVA